ncbi:hypothetical protein CANTEDRAFT_106147 [Yamadazyma tenuis ATCC 10573]|uniref:Major facilitator superfamily (MFS) profile domain-containing protein n=1 Tax=Candida tenuis (strain ATCC 10573 / BCRC 21748 / CBS 615 / JCM 9827 / NBRC 10315 / NRRL Y-1498 / VKM Y-70) TaxID=590646 RepID=G3B761_CANTC|nr:uncharacterized protein CANTEDRAFT_106147 [Yamadazyma tenuis ATCC 10573]EGV63109.1 hypothetical protein CANTEDRAFT_106147 [Yamadazyma tenuis ATCC 10573]
MFDATDFSHNYLIKTALLSKAMDEIGFGRYQYGLFFVAGFGWFADNAWPIVTSLIIPVLTETDGVHPPTGKGPYLTLAQNLGLLVGAAFWSLSADIIGRRWAFNLTFLITGVWAVVAGSAPNFGALGVFVSLWSVGVGGNLPVDSALFLEALPSTHQWLLTVMSGWWALGQLVANLISWGLIANFSCSTDSKVCLKADNKGWRYFLFTMGGLTLLFFIARFSFRVFESPRFYVARGRDDLAIDTLQKIAKINGTEVSLTLDQLQKVDEKYPEESTTKNHLVKEKVQKFNLEHLRNCFHSRKIAISSALVIFTWAIIGLAFPLYNAFLPYYLQTRGDANKPLSVHDTYRNSLIVSVIGIPGSIVAGFSVETKIGRKGTLIVSLLLTGVFLFASTTAKTSNANLGWNCAFSFVSNIMYGVLYAYTPEVFPAKIRGTGVGLAASANRILGVFAPIIAIYADLTTSAPIFVSGALFLASGVLVFFFPYEPRGHSSL